jgi:excinuclease ABC subunit A
VGLGYVRLGQSATTLSGGEAQRVKLALELSKRDTGRTLYILDEPTTGLHFHDNKLLLEVLTRLRDAGNTVVVIEHNLDVVKTADWVVDLGPEGGDGGGRIVAQGAPEQIAQAPESHTGRYLARVLTNANVRTISPPDGPEPHQHDAQRDPRRSAQGRKQARA